MILLDPKEYQKRGKLLASRFVPPFEGSIIENCQRFKFVGSGYDGMPKEQSGHFKIESARQCAGPLAALQDDRVRIVHVIGATQVLKSMDGDCWCIWSLEHEQKSMLVLFETDPKADLFCSRRLMDTAKSHPHIKPMLMAAIKESRHRVMGTWIKFIGFELLVAGLNDSNVSTLEWERIWISEAWQHANDGLLFKAFKRADHFPETSKILNESQASIAGTDLHLAIKKGHFVPLTWACPACGGRQTWEWEHWSHKRPDDFKPRARNKISIINIGGETAIVVNEPKGGTYAGMRWPDDIEGKMTIQRRAKQAYWECIHCGHHIHDTPFERKQLCDTYEQDYLINGVPAKQPVFIIPFEAAAINTFESTVANFLTAKRAKEQGNDIPLQDWFLSERAYFYEKGQTTALELSAVIGSYDPKEKIPNQHSVNMLVDCQKKIDAAADEDVVGSFWIIVEAVDNLGNSWDLGRFFATSWEDVIGIQKRFGIPNGRVCIDGRKWTPTILDMAAMNYEEVDAVFLGRKFKAKKCWMIFMGDDANYYKWGKVAKPYSQPHEHQRNVMVNGQRTTVSVFTHLWSNLAVSDQLHDIMQGGDGKVKINTLSRNQLDEKTRNREIGDQTYEKQINSEYRTTRKNKSFWEKKRPDNHYLDVRKMGLVRKMMDGLAGGVIDTTAFKAEENGEAEAATD